MDQIPCPDGYLLDASSVLSEGHHTLNHYLVRVEEAGWQTGLKEINAIRDKARKLGARPEQIFTARCSIWGRPRIHPRTALRCWSTNPGTIGSINMALSAVTRSVVHRLMLEYGLRYELYSPITERTRRAA